MSALLHDRLWRAPLLLAAATLAAVLAALYALHAQSRAVDVKFAPQPMFEGLAGHLDEVERIIITFGRGLNKPGTITLRHGAAGWTVAERHDYPADGKQVSRLLSGLASLTLYEKRTAKPAWHSGLGLLAPEEPGDGVRIAILDVQGRKMAELLVGKTPAQADGMVYVRRDGEDQTWLAKGRIPRLVHAQDWLSPEFLALEESGISRITLWAGSDYPVILSRAAAADDFVIENVPPGRVTRGGPVMNGVAGAIAALSFEDAIPLAEADFSMPVSSLNVETFDGLVLRMDLAGHEGALWAKMSASAPKDAAADQAGSLNARLSSWAYRLPEDSAAILTQNMDVLTHAGGL